MRSSAALLDRSGCVSGEERPTNARLARQLSRYPIDERNLVSEATEIVRDTRADKSRRHTRVIAYALKSPLKSNSWRKSRAKRPTGCAGIEKKSPKYIPPHCHYLQTSLRPADGVSRCNKLITTCSDPHITWAWVRMTETCPFCGHSDPHFRSFFR